MIQFDTQNNPYLEEISSEVNPVLEELDRVFSMVTDFGKMKKLSENIYAKIHEGYDGNSLHELLTSLSPLDPERIGSVSPYSFVTSDLVDGLKRLTEIADELSESATEVSAKPYPERDSDDDLIMDAYLYFFDDIYMKVKNMMRPTFPDIHF